MRCRPFDAVVEISVLACVVVIEITGGAAGAAGDSPTAAMVGSLCGVADDITVRATPAPLDLMVELRDVDPALESLRNLNTPADYAAAVRDTA